MAKEKKNGKTTSTKPSQNYQYLFVSTLKNKYQYLVGGLLVLLVLFGGALLLLKKVNPTTPKKTAPIAMKKPLPPTPPKKMTPVSPTQKMVAVTPTTAPKQMAQGDRTYTVKQGDNLWAIAEQMYGSGYNMHDIGRANNITNHSVIRVGQVLVIPSVTPQPQTIAQTTKGGVALTKETAKENGQISAAMTSQVTFTGTQYVVKPGDSLWEIAVQAYGDGFMWPQIAQANKLEHPRTIHVGNTLTIPAKPLN